MKPINQQTLISCIQQIFNNENEELINRANDYLKKYQDIVWIYQSKENINKEIEDYKEELKSSQKLVWELHNLILEMLKDKDDFFVEHIIDGDNWSDEYWNGGWFHTEWFNITNWIEKEYIEVYWWSF